ncbi:MAG: tRNA preQ1(34) S-adenosylmethionine ribosyltransferase-isomerase QueA [Geminicoccaceae bacterium]
MRVAEFDFELPKELIAQAPAAPRDSARLLRIGLGLALHTMLDLPDLLRPGDLLVVNDTKVLPTRFRAGRIEVTLVEAAGPDRWLAFAKPGKALRVGDRIELAQGLAAGVAEKQADGRVLLVFDLGGDALLAAIERHGAMPLPPYIRRPDGFLGNDRADYQTLFAAVPGAVAAPTAGLHFTDRLLAALDSRGIARVPVTLHVGMGTFAPVRVEDTRDHVMHVERYHVPVATAAAIAATRAAGGRIVAVGTTALRTLESAADEAGAIRAGSGETGIFITPGWRFRSADLLLTNFHLPRSTLFMLVCAFGGTGRLKEAYAHAVAERLRFFSYGDGCLIERDDGAAFTCR